MPSKRFRNFFDFIESADCITSRLIKIKIGSSELVRGIALSSSGTVATALIKIVITNSWVDSSPICLRPIMRTARTTKKYIIIERIIVIVIFVTVNIICRKLNNNTGGKMYLFKDFELNFQAFKSDFCDCSDFLIREAEVNGKKAFFCAMDGLIDSLQLNESVIEPVLKSELSFKTGNEHMDKIKKSVIGSIEISDCETFEDCWFYLSSGFVLFVLEDCGSAAAFAVQGWTRRTTDEPTNEAMVKGAKECFVETLNDNKALLRKRLKTPDLKLKQIKLGDKAPVPVVIAYIKGVAEEKVVNEVEEKLKKISIQTVYDYGCLEPFLKGKPTSFFSTVGNTERPDVLASKLLEGRVSVLVEGTPFVMYTPCLFSDSFSSLDDYDNPAVYASFVRLLKYFSFIISCFLPALYVAIGTYHQEMIPTTLLYIIASSEDTTPFPLVLEAVIIHILYEIMREAGLRLPKTIGHTVSIIGAIVIGEAMVSAGLIGEPMLVVVALTAISSYVVYPLYERVALIRLMFVILAGFTGIYGVTLGVCVMCVNICALTSFGVPFSAPVTPLNLPSAGDTLVRLGWKTLSKRRLKINSLGVNDENKS